MHMLKITVRLIATAILNDPFFHAFLCAKIARFVCPQSQLYGGEEWVLGILGTAESFVILSSTQFTNSQDTHLRISVQ